MKFKIESIKHQEAAILKTIEAVREGKKKIDIEMETGTGKTFTFISTIFESYKEFGFNKFVIIVPRVAIKEGVFASFKIFETHFKEKYPEIEYDVYNYNGNKRNIQSFIYNGSLQILILTPHSFNKKDINILTNEERDDLFGKESLLKQISKLKPCLIIDETHITGGKDGKTKDAILQFSPEIIFGYSATHIVKQDTVYSFSAKDAYEARQVKRLEYWNFEFENNNIDFTIEGFNPLAKTAKLIQNDKTKTIKIGSKVNDLKVKIITKDDVFFEGGKKYSDLQNKRQDENFLLQNQTKETIKEHLRKKSILNKNGIKVLSLFFVPSVNDFLNEGVILKMFLEEYKNQTKEEALNKFAYYFSQKKGLTESEKEKEMTNLILKQRQELLNLSNPVEFIFAHTSLGTGWDNPNIFQICFLRNITSEISRKQFIGRGLRLCVNQNGERIFEGMEVADGERINNLTIIANENYEKFCKEYQKESGLTEAEVKEQVKKQKPKQTLKANKEKLNFLKSLHFKLKQKTRWLISFGNLQEFYKKITNALNQIEVQKAVLTLTKTHLVTTENLSYQAISDLEQEYKEEEIIKKLSTETQLTKHELKAIFANLSKEHIKQNPKLWQEKAISVIMQIEEEHLLQTCEVKYEKLEGQEFSLEDFYIEERPTSNETIASPKSLYNLTDIDSEQEGKMIKELEEENNIEFYLKFQKTGGFHIFTPIGNYTPDFGILVKNTNGKFYLVLEVKGDFKSLSLEEKFKIKCAVEHFKSIGLEAKFNEYQDEFEGILGKSHKIKQDLYTVYNPK